MGAGVVIAGAGQAGFQCAFSLRTEGYDGAITLIGEEDWLPYQRPPLSKGCLSGKTDLDAIALRPAAYFQANRIALRMGRRVESIDRFGLRVILDDGGEVGYDYLVLATGCRNRVLAGMDGVSYLRTREEAAALMDRLETAGTVAVIGGGFIGLEVAAAATGHGRRVTVVEPQARLMQRAVGPIISEYFRAMHARHGVRILLGTTAAGLEGDMVVAGIGVAPRTELAKAAGLAVGNGIVVNAQLRTEDERIFAIGDCAAFPSRFARGMARLESVQNAVDQGRCVAAAICGRGADYAAVPWFWTDQFEAKLQMTGLSNGFDEQVVRGDLESGKFSVCYFREGRLIAMDSLNRPGDHLAGRKLLAAGTKLTAEQAADLGFDLKDAEKKSEAE